MNTCTQCGKTIAEHGKIYIAGSTCVGHPFTREKEAMPDHTPEEGWVAEFDEKFNIPHWKETGYNLNKVKDFIRQTLKDQATTILKELEKAKIEFVDDDFEKGINVGLENASYIITHLINQ